MTSHHVTIPNFAAMTPSQLLSSSHETKVEEKEEEEEKDKAEVKDKVEAKDEAEEKDEESKAEKQEPSEEDKPSSTAQGRKHKHEATKERVERRKRQNADMAAVINLATWMRRTSTRSRTGYVHTTS